MYDDLLKLVHATLPTLLVNIHSVMTYLDCALQKYSRISIKFIYPYLRRSQQTMGRIMDGRMLEKMREAVSAIIMDIEEDTLALTKMKQNYISYRSWIQQGAFPMPCFACSICNPRDSVCKYTWDKGTECQGRWILFG